MIASLNAVAGGGFAAGALLVKEHGAGHVGIPREPLCCLGRSRVVADGVPAA
jgi:hypothetical protein